MPAASESTTLQALKAQVDAWLEANLPDANLAPESVHQAMRYAVLGGGKRLRPLLALTFGEALGVDRGDLLPAAACVELIHASSLIFDDLPAMDNDDFRRARPSCHRAFGEANAILAGCALITSAFGHLAVLHQSLGGDRAARLVTEFAAATSSVRGLVSGQASDLSPAHSRNLADVELTHGEKTGSIFALATVIPIVIAGGKAGEVDRCRSAGNLLGLAYQIADDIRDEGEPSERPAYTDVAVDGLARVHELTERALKELAAVSGGANPLLEALIAAVRSV